MRDSHSPRGLNTIGSKILQLENISLRPTHFLSEKKVKDFISGHNNAKEKKV